MITREALLSVAHLNNTEAARHLGVPRTTLRDARERERLAFQPKRDELLDELGLSEEYVTSRGLSRRLEDGSWEKVTWKPNAKALSDSLKYDDFSDLFSGWTPANAKPLTFNAVPVLCLADLQIGKANQRGGGTPETIAKVRAGVEKFVGYVKSVGASTVVLVDLGDPIENIYNAPEQVHTNDLSVPEQIRVFRRLMIETIKAVAHEVPNVIYVTVPSNHGRFRTAYKTPGGSVDADFGLEISHQIEDAIQENPVLASRVTFVRPEPLNETAVVDLTNTDFDVKLAFNHGHQSNGQNGMGAWWARQDHGRMPGWDADILVVGHYHNLRLEQSGDARWIIGASSPDPGSDHFTLRSGDSAVSGLTSFDVAEGKWTNLRIL